MTDEAPLHFHVPEPSARPGRRAGLLVPRRAAGRRGPPPGHRRRPGGDPRPRLLDDPRARRRRRAPSARGPPTSTPTRCGGRCGRWSRPAPTTTACCSAQRQGKTSFYMRCTGEEAIAVGQALELEAARHVLPDVPPAGLADRPRLAARRHDVPDLLEREGPPARPPDAGHVLGHATPASSPSPATSARSTSRPSGGRWRRRSRATRASRPASSARARRPRPTSTTPSRSPPRTGRR